ncbi:MAG: PilN domain-containing protein [Candidatus Riflebacteria bacterium]|nr:PilN domain-containing protein [Candidatus Riflebacteria bacterium]
MGRHLEWQRGKDGGSAGVWVTDLLAAPGVAAAVLTTARESGCCRLTVELESSPVLRAVPGAIVLGLSFEPARAVFGIWRAGRPPYVLRPVALATGGGETAGGEPSPIEPQALIAPGREILARARARGVEPESLVLDEQVVGPRISAAGAEALAELLALPLRIESRPAGKETAPPGLAFTLKEPASFGRSCVQALGSAIGRYPRALPVLLVLVALAQVAFLLHGSQATAELTERIGRLTQAPIAGAAEGTAGRSDPRVAELRLLSDQRSRSLHALLTEVEPLLPDTMRLTRVGLSREGRLAIAGRAREAGAVNRMFSSLQQVPGFRNVFLIREEAVRDSSVKDKAVLIFELAAEVAEASPAREASEGPSTAEKSESPVRATARPQLSGGHRGR